MKNDLSFYVIYPKPNPENYKNVLDIQVFVPSLFKLSLHKSNVLRDLCWYLCCLGKYHIVYAYKNGELMHHSYTIEKNPRMPFMQKNSICIINSFTAPKYRNQGVFSEVLSFVNQFYAHKTKYIFVNNENLSSKKAIENANFTLIGQGREQKISKIYTINEPVYSVF